ncbi:single-strand binding protein [Beutenbergia cavernae DSM 12333]|uniref:Single-stranded DNA-binding protein n=1 Tax=Beutenbergia cavernae (strain ATCC BAA-8 / DSM 12333 / CCUG 43141 / JCM 11478 / NBRC 16432 / NCIMB 13614 / HKI 0122) TaxID=471853 RepID=C5BXK5_BEUC1|nr:single-stranded DNA-binding protein [Beutenbergia cavernae]ACQ80888.1 single-strand binding protein [Beutenbergia cavernae DSM 12333]
MKNDIHITVSGRAGNTATLSRNGKDYAKFRLASNRRSRNAQGEWADEPTQWFTVKCWGELAHNVAASVRTGTPVLVRGVLGAETYLNGQGAEVTDQEIRANAVAVELSHGIATYAKTVREKDGAQPSPDAGDPRADDPWGGTAGGGEPADSAEPAADAEEPALANAGASEPPF